MNEWLLRDLKFVTLLEKTQMIFLTDEKKAAIPDINAQ